MNIIYLDQLHWINLAKAEAGRNEWSHLCPFLKAAIKSKSAGTACFPVSSINIMELARIGKMEQRLQLARLMIKLSGGWVLPPQSSLVDPWLEYSLRSIFSLERCELPKNIIKRGIFNAFPDQAREELMKLTTLSDSAIGHIENAPEGWLSYVCQLDDKTRRYAIKKMTETNDNHTKGMKKRRKHLRNESREIRYRAYCVTLIDDLQDTIVRVMDHLGLDHRKLQNIGPEKGKALLNQVPVLDVEIELSISSEQQWSRAVEPNDWYDVAALSVAIPFCDCVATENYWKSIAQQTGLDNKYQTQIVNDLEDILPFVKGSA